MPQSGVGSMQGANKGRGEHFPEFAKNHWGKVPIFWDLGKSSMKFNSACVVTIWDGGETFLNVKSKLVLNQKV